MVGLLPPSAGGIAQLEGPQEVGGVLEVGANSEDLVDQILNADDAHLAQLPLDDLVGSDGSAVTIDLNKRVQRQLKREIPIIFSTKCIKLFPD